jgi:hypothetical protein
MPRFGVPFFELANIKIDEWMKSRTNNPSLLTRVLKNKLNLFRVVFGMGLVWTLFSVWFFASSAIFGEKFPYESPFENSVQKWPNDSDEIYNGTRRFFH